MNEKKELTIHEAIILGHQIADALARIQQASPAFRKRSIELVVQVIWRELRKRDCSAADVTDLVMSTIGGIMTEMEREVP